jgi:hypothetical protein
MAAHCFEFAADDEAELDDEAREILLGLRELCRGAWEGVAPVQTLATSEDRHLRLRIEHAEDRRQWFDLLVGDGYTEINGPGGSEYSGYLTPDETLDRVRERLARWMRH